MVPGVAFLYVCLAPASQLASAETVGTLQTTSQFADAYVGIAGSPSEQFIALRAVLKSSDAATVCRKLTKQPRVPGQLYGLLGLRQVDRSTYRSILTLMRNQPDVQVERMSGCVISRESMHEVLEEIDRGDFDRWAREPSTRPAS